MSAGEVVAFVVLIVFLVVPFLLILPSLMEILLGWDFSKDGETQGQNDESAPEDRRSSRG